MAVKFCKTIKPFKSGSLIKWRHDNLHNDIQHNDIEHNNAQYDDIQFGNK
jgi:hypothetical protein